MNLIPIPGLDGGHILFTLIEMITGRKPGDRFMAVMQVIGMGQDRNVNKAFSQAQHRASVVQASQKEIKIKVVTDLIISSSSEKISNTSMLHAEQFINQQKPIVSLYRKNKDNYEVQLLYVIKN